MKKYEKPMVMIMPLEGNVQLCGSCSNGQIINPDDPMGQVWNEEIAKMIGDVDGVLTREEAKNLFGNGEASCTDALSQKIEGYCKFTSTGDKLVAWS